MWENCIDSVRQTEDLLEQPLGFSLTYKREKRWNSWTAFLSRFPDINLSLLRIKFLSGFLLSFSRYKKCHSWIDSSFLVWRIFLYGLKTRVEYVCRSQNFLLTRALLIFLRRGLGHSKPATLPWNKHKQHVCGDLYYIQAHWTVIYRTK
jgi:hypothetical protein